MNEKINFAWPITSESGIVYEHILKTIKQNRDVIFGKRVVIFGAGIRGCFLLSLLEMQGTQEIVFCDNNQEKHGHFINQYEIVSLKTALAYEKEQIFLISPENSTSMGKQLIEAGLIENKDFVSFDFSIYDSYMAEYHRSLENHGVFMGDCAFSHIAVTDENRMTFGDMLKEEIGEQHCKVLNVYGIGQRANYNIIQSIIDTGERPSVLVLLVVLEALTSKFHIMPRTQHPELMQRIIESHPSPREEFIEYSEITKRRSSQLQVESFTSYRKEEDDSNEKLFMKMNYLYTIRQETEGVAYLKKIIRLLNNENIPIVIYIPPVNYEQGDRFFGELFRNKYTENFESLFKFLDDEELAYDVIDASFLLSEDEFAARNTIDETTNYKGRVKLLKFFSESEHLNFLFSKSRS